MITMKNNGKDDDDDDDADMMAVGVGDAKRYEIPLITMFLRVLQRVIILTMSFTAAAPHKNEFCLSFLSIN